VFTACLTIDTVHGNGDGLMCSLAVEHAFTIDTIYGNGDGLMGSLAVEHALPLIQFMAMEMVS